MIAALAAEPFYLKLEEIAHLTEWQIEHIYFRYALERQERIERALAEQSAKHGRRRGLGTDVLSAESGEWTLEKIRRNPQAFALYYCSMLQALGMSREQAQKQVEEEMKPLLGN